MDYSEMFWLRLGRIDPADLNPTRVALHWAAQLIGAVGDAVLPHAPDEHHTSMEWTPDHGGFVGQPLPNGHRAFLDIRWLRVGLRLDPAPEDPDVKAEVFGFELAGHTLQEGLDALSGALTDAGYALDAPLALRDYAMPDHPVRDGAAFEELDPDHTRELARWYHNAASVLGPYAAQHDDAAPLRAWPHHFDIATLTALDDADDAPSVNAGLSPGDASLPEPYFYVVPHPKPASGAPLPQLTAPARWHSDGWTGAVIDAAALVAMPSGKQRDTITRFVQEATEVCTDMLTHG